jgi:glycosyltransferase involved in cell wall biosynthesis
MLIHAGLGALVASLRGFDVVHIHACGPALFAWLPHLAGKAVICTLHGQDWRAPKWGKLAKTGLKLGEWAACRLPTRTAVVSRTYAAYLRETYGIEAACIPNGVAPVRYRPMERAGTAFGLMPKEYVVFVGRLTPGKNVHHLIEAFRTVETSKKLVIVGGEAQASNYVDRLRALAAGDERVVFTGPLHGDLLAEVFANACLFAFPTEHEGMPVALLEALAYGLPALVSDIPENLEVIEDGHGRCGFTFPMGSVPELAFALSKALAQPDLQEGFGRRGRELATRRYSWDRAAERTEALYYEALSQVLRYQPQQT